MQYQQFLDVAEAADRETLRTRLVDFAAHMGFGRMGAIVVTDHPGQDSSYVMMNNAPAAFVEATRDVDDSRRDPVLQRLKKWSVPFVYDQQVYVEAGAADLWEEQAPHGYKTGISVALHLPGGKHFMLGFDREDPLPASDEALTRMLADLQLVAVHAQDAALRLLTVEAPARSTVALSPRELEVLRWTAAGKTAWETARILQVSEHTVTFHMRGILKKLDVPSKHQAVLTALASGII